MTHYIEASGFGNHILYKMCDDFPLNSDPEIVGGKLWLIGRAYAASVERKAGPDFDWEPLKASIAESGIDQQIRKCRDIERVDKNNLPTVLSTHKLLTRILKDKTGLEKRSLASKYLHFHAPSAFFIYDSIAARELRDLVPAARLPRTTSIYDSAYHDFCLRCLQYRDTLLMNVLGKTASPRQLDMDLLAKARKRRGSRK